MILDKQEEQRRYSLRLAGIRDSKVYIGPEIVHLHVTTRCNLFCRYCWYHSPRQAQGSRAHQDFSLSAVRRIVRDAVKIKTNAIYLSGEGEPSLHPRFPEIVRFLADQPLSSTLFTNATFPAGLCRDIVRLDRVLVNLGACDRTGYRQLQGRDLFSQVTGNIRRLVRLRNKYHPALRIELVFVVNRINAEFREKMKRLVSELGADAMTEMAMQEHAWNKDLTAEAGHAPLVCREVLTSFPLCFLGWFYVSVAVDGNVSMCCHLDQMRIANVKRVTLRDAWHSRSFQRARLEGKRGVFNERFEECRHCRELGQNKETARVLALLRPYG